MASSNSDMKLTVDLPKDAGDYNKYMEELYDIENETGISIKVVIKMKGDPDQLKVAQKRIYEIQYSDKTNPIKPVDFEDGQNVSRNITEEFKNDLNIIKKELNVINNINREIQAKLETLTNKIDVEMAKTSDMIHKTQDDLSNVEIDEINCISEDDLKPFINRSEYRHWDCDGRQPLHIASILGRLDIVANLFKKGVDINCKDNSGYTALHHSARYGKLDLLQYLLKNNAAINQQDINGYTPLILAVLNGQKDVVEYLCSKKADIHIKNDDNKTALDIARGINRPEIRKILEKYANKT